MDKTWVKELKEHFSSSEIIENAELKKMTTWQIGGPAEVLISPGSVAEIKAILDFAKNNRIKHYVIGKGSNILVSDKGLEGITIHLGKNFSGYSFEGDILKAEAGLSLNQAAGLAMDRGLSGLEEFSMIPGTLGGAAFMNAGAHGKEIKDIIQEITVYQDGEIRKYSSDELSFSYRNSMMQEKELIVLEVVLRLAKADKALIEEKMEHFKDFRKKQPGGRNAGSVFRNPEGYSAGQLIEECGLKGRKIGGAFVSEVHANFIINDGSAKASDVMDLIEEIQHMVYSKNGIKLERETKILGF